MGRAPRGNTQDGSMKSAYQKRRRDAVIRSAVRMLFAVLTVAFIPNPGRRVKHLWRAAYSSYYELENVRDPSA